MARALLVAVAAGSEDSSVLAHELAKFVLRAEPGPRLAAAVLDGGPHALDRAVELAEVVLDPSGTFSPGRKESGAA